LPLEDLIHTSSSLLYETNALCGIIKALIPWHRLMNQDVLRRYPFRETTRAGKFNAVRKPLNEDSANPPIVTVKQSIQKGLSESCFGVIRNWQTYQPYLDFLFFYAGIKTRLKKLRHFQQGLPKELIHPDISVSGQYLKGHLMR
jgi:hypothetical protein